MSGRKFFNHKRQTPLVKHQATMRAEKSLNINHQVSVVIQSVSVRLLGLLTRHVRKAFIA